MWQWRLVAYDVVCHDEWSSLGWTVVYSDLYLVFWLCWLTVSMDDSSQRTLICFVRWRHLISVVQLVNGPWCAVIIITFFADVLWHGFLSDIINHAYRVSVICRDAEPEPEPPEPTHFGRSRSRSRRNGLLGAGAVKDQKSGAGFGSEKGYNCRKITEC